MSMAYLRKNLTPAERSEIYRQNAAKRKKFGGGRKRGSGNSGPDGIPRKAVSRTTIQMSKEDAEIFRRFAHLRYASIFDAMHIIAETLVRQIPSLKDDNSDKSFRI